MTFGSASPARSASLTQRAPLGARVPRGTCALKTVSSSGKCVNTCSTTPSSRRHFVLACPSAARLRAHDRCRNHAPIGCPALPSWTRASPCPDAFATARVYRRAERRRRRRGAACLRALAICAGMSARCAKACAAQASLQGHNTQAGRLGEQIVAPRSISACAKSPERCGGNKRRCPSLDRGLGRRQRFFDREQPCHHALDIAVHRHRRQIEGDRGDRRGGVVADARQRTQRRQIGWKLSAMVLHDRAGASVQITRPRVIAEPGPDPQHVIEAGCGERGHARPALNKAREIRRDRLDRGLLQHDLGQPDPIGIGPRTFARPPRQNPPMAVVPGEQIGRVRRDGWFLSRARTDCYGHGADDGMRAFLK